MLCTGRSRTKAVKSCKIQFVLIKVKGMWTNFPVPHVGQYGRIYYACPARGNFCNWLGVELKQNARENGAERSRAEFFAKAQLCLGSRKNTKLELTTNCNRSGSSKILIQYFDLVFVTLPTYAGSNNGKFRSPDTGNGLDYGYRLL